jgi:hypothetical protein
MAKNKIFMALPLLILASFIGSDNIVVAADERLPLMHQPSLSPDGTKLAFFQGVQGEMVLRVVGLDDKKQYTLKRSRKTNFVWNGWANNDRLLFSVVQSHDRGFDENKFYITEPNEFYGIDAGDYDSTRLFSVTNQLKSPVSIFQLGEGVIRKRGESLSKALLRIPAQGDIIDMLENDPEHIITNNDEDDDNETKVRKVSVVDGSFVLMEGEKRGIVDWLTDNDNQVRYAIGNVLFNLQMSNTNENGAVPLDQETNRRTVKSARTGDMYLNPRTGSWVPALNKNWVSDDKEVVGFDSDPRYAFLKRKDGSYVLHDMIADKTVDAVAGGVPIGGLLSKSRSVFDNSIAGYRDATGDHYFDEYYAQVQITVDSLFNDGYSQIVSAVPDIQKFVIYNKPTSSDGAFYILDLSVGSMSKVSNRY